VVLDSVYRELVVVAGHTVLVKLIKLCLFLLLFFVCEFSDLVVFFFSRVFFFYAIADLQEDFFECRDTDAIRLYTQQVHTLVEIVEERFKFP